MSGRRKRARPDQIPEVQRSATGQVTLLDDSELGVQTLSTTVRPSRLRPLLLVVAALLVPGVIAFMAFGLSDSPDSATPSEETSGDASAVAAASAEEFDELRAYGSGGVQLDNRYSEINSALDAVVVVGTVGAAPAQPLQLYGPAPKLEVFPPGNRALNEMTFDASGNWLAGLYKNTFDQEVLMVGRLDGADWVMDPVALRINGFAWHPTEPGVIAFAKLNNFNSAVTDVVVEDYTQRRVISRRFRADFPGRLRLWGDWGMAFDEPGPVSMTAVATFEGKDFSNGATGANILTTLVEGVPGTALGELGPNRILIDGADEPTIVNTNNAVFEPNVWIEPGTEVAAMLGSPDGKFSVALVVDRYSSDGSGGDIVLLAADPTSVNAANELLFTTSGPTTFDWTPDGRFVTGFEPAELDADGQRRRAASVTVYDLDRSLYVGREIRESVGGDLDLRFRANAVAFQETIND